jgi:hypothetical protein
MPYFAGQDIILFLSFFLFSDVQATQLAALDREFNKVVESLKSSSEKTAGDSQVIDTIYADLRLRKCCDNSFREIICFIHFSSRRFTNPAGTRSSLW